MADGARLYCLVGVDGWEFAPSEEDDMEAFSHGNGCTGSPDNGGGGGGDTAADRGRGKQSEASGVAGAVALEGDAIYPGDGGATGARVLLRPSAFFASGNTVVATKAVAVEEVGASVETAGTGGLPGGDGGDAAVEQGGARGARRGASRHRKRRPRKGGDGSSRRAKSP